MSYFVGVDVGGTTITVSIGNANREVLKISDQIPTKTAEGPSACVKTMVQGVQGIVRPLGIPCDQIQSLGLSTPGPATPDGVLFKSPNLKHPEWDRFPIRKELEVALHEQSVPIKVHYIGDGQAAALGEFSIRKGRMTWPQSPRPITTTEKLSSLFMAVVGTGLGGGEVRDSKVVCGMEGRAGHVGHLLLPEFAFRYPHDRTLEVGHATSTVESAVSLTALTHQLAYRLSLDEWKDHPLQKEAGTVKDKAKKLRGFADNGDELALQLFDDQARALGIAMLDVNYLGDYDLLVIGGGVCDLSETVRRRYQKIAEDTYRKYALDGFKNLEHIEFSACGDDAPVIGALAHAFDQHP